MMTSKKLALILSLMLIWMAFTIFALTWGFRYDWPDAVHVDYGLPLVWATHTLSTIAGPVDMWQVNHTNLQIDLLLWIGTMTVAVAVTLYTLNRKA